MIHPYVTDVTPAAAADAPSTPPPARSPAPPPLTLFLRPPLVLNVRGMENTSVMIETFVHEPRFTVNDVEDLSLDAAIHAIATQRAYPTRRSAETVLASLFVLIPVSPSSTYFLPWGEFAAHSTVVTQTRIVLELPRKRRGRDDGGGFSLDLPPSFVQPWQHRPPPERAPRRRTALPLPSGVAGGENPHSSPIPTVARAAAARRDEALLQEDAEADEAREAAQTHDFVAAARIAGWIGGGDDDDTTDDDSASEATIDYPDELTSDDDEEAAEQAEAAAEASPARRLAASFVPPPPPPPSVCSLCCEEEFDAPSPLRSLGEASAGVSALVLPPCGVRDHAVCTDCLARLAVCWHNHGIGPGSSHITCPHDGCTSAYETEHFATVLGAEDMRALRARAARFSENTLVGCPGCGEIVELLREDVRDSEEGTIVIACHGCNWRFCFHCLGSLGSAALPFEVVCQSCMEGRVCEGSLNRYFVRPGKTLTDGEYPHMRNYELSVALCAQQITQMCTDEELSEPCAGCGGRLHKASACNEVSHCGIHRCWFCGMSGFENESQLIDHFGEHGCPLYDDSPFWRSLGLPTLCDSSCQNDFTDCARADHAERRRAQTTIRRLAHVRAALGSMHAALRDRVLEALYAARNPEVGMVLAYATCFDRGLRRGGGGM